MNNKFLVWLNYASRGMVVLIGIFWVSGFFGFIPSMNNDNGIRIFGVVIILFGVYRLAMYWNQRQMEERYYDE
jgi:hypothetical protein